MLLEYAENEATCEDFIPDLNKMLTAGEQLSTLITQLFSKNDSSHGEIDFESLTSTIRHNLRTPINAIIGYGEMILEDVDDDDHLQASVDLQKILTTARRLLTLIGDLSYLSKQAESKKTEKKAEPEREPTVSVPSSALDKPKTSSVINKAESTLYHTPLLNPTGSENSTCPTGIDFYEPAHLLVVDDNKSNRELLIRRLKKQGDFEIEEAENGEHALQMLRDRNFDLVLLDIIMPEMNGYQVLEKLKYDKELNGIPVIMMSALDEIDSVVHCIEMGAEDYLQKPFNQVILNAKISATLDRKRLRDRERAYLKKLQEEQEKSEKLLLNILPELIAERLKKGENTIADSFPDVTVLFSDLVGFTELSTGISASALVEKLNRIFLAFDQLIERYHLEKIKTIGDAYMLVGGIPTPRTDHIEVVADMAMGMLQEIELINQQNHENFKIRVGIHTGPVVAGVIGKNKFIYDLWGDTVNIASRMESQGIPGCVQVSQTTYERLKDKFKFEQRGPIEVKGKGKMVTYLLRGRK
jgi:class 3 adenylate cyclase